MASARHQHHIDLDRLAEIPTKGVRRAAVFLGLGVNAARDERFVDYTPSTFSMHHFVQSGLPGNVVTDFKRHFEDWVVNNALRDIIESFEAFLDSLHLICLRVDLSHSLLAPADFAKARSKFEHHGCDGKLTGLAERYQIATSKAGYFAAIKQVRNCITHRRGIVGPKDVGQDGKLHLTWWRMRLFLKGESGQEIEMEAPFPEGGYLLEEAGTVCLQFCDRTRIFDLGGVVKFSPGEVLEICHLTQFASGELIKSLVAHLKRRGVQVSESRPAGG